MNARIPLGIALVALALPTAAAWGGPPAGYACVAGYNPAALLNVCYDQNNSPSTDDWLNDGATCVYVIGNLPGCVGTVSPNAPGIRNDVPGLWVQDSALCGFFGDTPPYCQTIWLA